jgi:S1-C subfamily serine protease
VPVHELRHALERLTRGETTPRAWLGVRVLKSPVAGGLKIVEVSPEGPAETAGVKGGDVIRSLEGRPLGQIDDLRDALREAKAGDRLTAEVARDGEVLCLPIQVGARE